jgi:hypothetical protein
VGRDGIEVSLRRKPIILGALSRSTIAAWARHADLVPVTPSQVVGAVEAVRPDLVFLDGFARSPGEAWRNLGEPSFWRHDFAAARLVEDARRMGVPSAIWVTGDAWSRARLNTLRHKCDVSFSGPGGPVSENHLRASVDLTGSRWADTAEPEVTDADPFVVPAEWDGVYPSMLRSLAGGAVLRSGWNESLVEAFRGCPGQVVVENQGGTARGSRWPLMMELARSWHPAKSIARLLTTAGVAISGAAEPALTVVLSRQLWMNHEAMRQLRLPEDGVGEVFLAGWSPGLALPSEVNAALGAATRIAPLTASSATIEAALLRSHTPGPVIRIDQPSAVALDAWSYVAALRSTGLPAAFVGQQAHAGVAARCEGAWSGRAFVPGTDPENVPAWAVIPGGWRP